MWYHSFKSSNQGVSSMISNSAVEFTVDCKGELTGQTFQGVFKARPLLSHRAKLDQDKMRRSLMGDKPEEASVVTINTAASLSYIFHHLESAPAWWRESNNGLDLVDVAPVNAVYEAILALEEKVYADIKKAGEAAATALTPKK